MRPRDRTDVVVLCTDATYFLPCAFLIEQLAREPGAERFDIALVHQGVSGAQIAHLEGRLGRLGRLIVAIAFDAEPAALPGQPSTAHVSRATYLKLHVHRLLPAQYTRILYLDSDIYIERPGTAALFDLDLGDAAFAAGLGGLSEEVICPEVMSDSMDPRASRRTAMAHHDGLGLEPGDAYLNSGVMLIDRTRWTESDIPGRALAFALAHPDRCAIAEESALNAVGRGQWAKLSPRWNFLWSHLFGGLQKPMRPVLRHFAGPYKPWNTEIWGAHYKRAYDGWLAASGWRAAFPQGPSDPPRLGTQPPKRTWFQRRLRSSPTEEAPGGAASADPDVRHIVRIIGAERHAAFRHAALAVLAFHRFVDLPEPERRSLLDALVEPVLSERAQDAGGRVLSA